MPNPYYQFKQFTIHQGRCAMKVTTDGCLFGGWVARLLVKMQIKNESENISVLDIGAGTGLLSLMLAQKLTNAHIEAVEIDENAAHQCQENFNNSPWKNRLKIHHNSIQNFAKTNHKKYDIIITNPPFYENQLASPNVAKNRAHHSDGLSLEELFLATKNLLKMDGSFILLLPYYRLEETKKKAALFGLNITKKTVAKQTPKHPFFRAILEFNFNENEAIFEEEIIIKNMENQYTESFKDLMKDYYLKLAD